MPVADTLLRLAEPPALYEARWTEQILAEVARTLAVRFGKSREQARYRAAAMRQFFPASLVENYQDLIADMKNQAKDRHVLAAAVACHADYLITFNLKHFVWQPAGAYKVAAIGPSTFLNKLAALDRPTVEARICDQAAAIGVSVDNLLDRLAGSVPGFVSRLRSTRLWDRPSASVVCQLPCEPGHDK
jgi:predicted nucleic acid-binding protein